jgi:ABC-type multidrug transport system fused ATPase/permease subunit
MKKFLNLEGLSFKDFFFFDKMLTPVFITLIYWISLAGILIFGLIGFFGSFFAMFSFSFRLGILGIFSSLFFILAGLVTTRLTYELIYAIFNINRNIKKLASTEEQNKE